MANFSITNLDVLNNKEVRLYRVSADGDLVPAPGMTVLDSGNASAGARIARRNIQPVTNVSGILVVNDDAVYQNLEVTNLDNINLTPTNSTGLKAALETIGFSVYDLTVWSKA